MNEQIQGTADFIQGYADGYADGYARKDRREYLSYSEWKASSNQKRDSYEGYNKGYSAGWFDRKDDDYRNSTPEQRKARLQRELDLEIEAMELDEQITGNSTRLSKATYPDDAIEALNFINASTGPLFPKEG